VGSIETVFDLSEVAAGTYFLAIVTEDGFEGAKVVVIN